MKDSMRTPSFAVLSSLNANKKNPVKMKSKNKSLRTALGALALGLAISAAPVASADQDSQVAAFKKTLSNVSSPELPAQAAKLVAQANAKEQNSVAAAVVRAAVEKNRASATF